MHRLFLKGFIIRKEDFVMPKEFSSVYATHINEFIAQKTKLGLRHMSFIGYLARIDRFAFDSRETSMGITREFSDKWYLQKLHESSRNRSIRVRCLSEFSSYLVDLGIPSFIPKVPAYEVSTFTPYIYSVDQINSLFKILDSRYSRTNGNSNIFSAPIFFRVLYCTGIRYSEALELKDQEVNLDESYLIIKDCKNYKQRTIPIAESLSSLLREYRKHRDASFRERRRDDLFFLKPNGERCGKAMKEIFRDALIKANIPLLGRGHGPRIHDLRHTFAVFAMIKMIKNGFDLYASLPILSTYLGHQSIAATNGYVRLTSNLYPQITKDLDTAFDGLYPKILI